VLKNIKQDFSKRKIEKKLRKKSCTKKRKKEKICEYKKIKFIQNE
jgi:hypothetical protein